MTHHPALPTFTHAAGTVRAADGTTLSIRRYPESGVSHGAPVLLVHGFGSDAQTNWLLAGWVRALRQAHRQLIAVDLRGHGNSDRPRESSAYSMRAMTADLQAVLSAALPDGGVLDAVGYSLGARLTLEFAAQSRATAGPHQLNRLVIGGSSGAPLFQGIDPAQLDRALTSGIIPDDFETARIARITQALPGNDPLALAALARGLATDPDSARRAPDPAQPILLAVGSADPLSGAADEWAARLRRGGVAARFVPLPGRDHLTAVPSGVFRAAAVEFLSQ